MTSVIESADYEETRQALMKDPIVIEMVRTMGPVTVERIAWEDGTPRFDFMLITRDEYRRRGGVGGGHLGAVAEAMLRLLEESGRPPR